MGLLDKLKGAARPTAKPVVVSLPGGKMMQVKGESYNEPSFISICGPRSTDGYDLAVTAQLRAEPTNVYDRNAVQVLVNGRLVGHLSRDDAAEWSPILLKRLRARNEVMECSARIRGGWGRGGGDTGNFGITLDLCSAAIAAVHALR